MPSDATAVVLSRHHQRRLMAAAMRESRSRSTIRPFGSYETFKTATTEPIPMIFHSPLLCPLLGRARDGDASDARELRFLRMQVNGGHASAARQC